MAGSECDLEELKTNIKCVLSTSQKGMNTKSLCMDLKELTDTKLPFKEFGFNSPEDFICSSKFENILDVTFDPFGNKIFFAKCDKAISHVQMLVAGQKRQKVKKRPPPPRSAYPSNSYSSRQYNPSYSSSRPSNNNFAKPRSNYQGGSSGPSSRPTSTLKWGEYTNSDNLFNKRYQSSDKSNNLPMSSSSTRQSSYGSNNSYNNNNYPTSSQRRETNHSQPAKPLLPSKLEKPATAPVAKRPQYDFCSIMLNSRYKLLDLEPHSEHLISKSYVHSYNRIFVMFNGSSENFKNLHKQLNEIYESKIGETCHFPPGILPKNSECVAKISLETVGWLGEGYYRGVIVDSTDQGTVLVLLVDICKVVQCMAENVFEYLGEFDAYPAHVRICELYGTELESNSERLILTAKERISDFITKQEFFCCFVGNGEIDPRIATIIIADRNQTLNLSKCLCENHVMKITKKYSPSGRNSPPIQEPPIWVNFDHRLPTSSANNESKPENGVSPIKNGQQFLKGDANTNEWVDKGPKQPVNNNEEEPSTEILSIDTLMANLDVITYRGTQMIKWEQINAFLFHLYDDIHTFQFACDHPLDLGVITPAHNDHKHFVNKGVCHMNQPLILISLKCLNAILPQLVFDRDVAGILQNYYCEQSGNLVGSSDGQPKLEKSHFELILRLLDSDYAHKYENPVLCGNLKQIIASYLQVV